MKNSAEYAARIKKLLGRIKKNNKELPTAFQPATPIQALLLGCLAATAPENKAMTALKKIEHHFVDMNELRVARDFEIVSLLGKTFPQAPAVTVHIKKLLNSINDGQGSLSLSYLTETGKREAKAALEKYEGMTPFLTAWVMMSSLGGHCFPVTEKMFEMLMAEEAINPKSDIGDVQGFLERHITSNELIETYTLLRYFSDHGDKAAKAEAAAGNSADDKAQRAVKAKTAKAKTTTAKSSRKKSEN